jgi:hypothetical protein
MGRPVKVSGDVYGRLAQTAAMRGITIQEALRRDMEETRSRAERVTRELEEARGALAQREQKLARAGAERQGSAAELVTERERGRKHVARVRELEEERARAKDALGALRAAAEELEANRDAAVERAKAAERSGQGWTLVSILLGCLVLFLAAVMFREKPRPAEETVAQPPLPATWPQTSFPYGGVWR